MRDSAEFDAVLHTNVSLLVVEVI